MVERVSIADAQTLSDSVRQALRQLSTSADVREHMAAQVGWSTDVWRRLSAELGLPGLMVPPRYGGAGMSCVEMAIAFEQAGASLLCAPLFSTAALAVPLLLALDDAQALERYAAPIAAGEMTATVAFAERDGDWGLDPKATRAEPSANGWTISGRKCYVVDGDSAPLILVTAQTSAGPAVFAIEGAAGVEREPLVTLDQTRRMAHLQFRAAPARLVGTAESAPAAFVAMSDLARVLLAAEQTGGAQRCLDMTADYARSRIQFGRPIGSFQAVKQHLAEMLVLVESARSATGHAAESVASGAADASSAAHVAALTAGDAFHLAAAQCIQLHGGIGFTWEHDAHLYFKRALTSRQLLGGPDTHVAAVATQLEQLVS